LRRLPREVAVFVHREGRLLTLHRTQENYWHVVAGALERGETFADAAARELHEETGLVAEPIDLGLEQTYTVTEYMRAVYPEGTSDVVVGNFHVNASADWQPVLNEEHDRYLWAYFAVAREMMYWPETQAAIDVLARRLSLRP
jgi:8-oxo-dGTP pyrophosphatase MutT (NUDIX family)